jgi:hypothetical protein
VRKTLATTALATGAAALLLLLSACSTGGTTGNNNGGTPKPTTSSAPTSATPTPPADVLFTVAANVRAKDGSTIGILMTVHKPVPYSDAAAKPLENTFIKQCGAGVGGQPVTVDTLSTNGSTLVPIDLAATESGKTYVAPVQLALGSPYFGQSASGKGISPTDPTQPCYGGYNWSISGNASAVADFESGIPGPDLKLWRYAYYGFGVAYDSNATVEACKITLTGLATADDVASVTGWDPTAPQSGTSCGIGYTGE